MLLRIKVKPNSKVDQVSVMADGTLSVKIKALPIDGKANKYLVEYLAKVFGISKAYIQVVKGESNSNKTVQINAADEYIISKINSFKS